VPVIWLKLKTTASVLLFAVGLYAETHGIVDNYMYDVKHDTEFLIGDNPDQYFSYWWDDGEPLWITASKQVRETNSVFTVLHLLVNIA